jgi:hypothetical protein
MIYSDGVVHSRDFSSILLFDQDGDIPFVVTYFLSFAILIVCSLREEIIKKESIFDDLFVIMGKRAGPSELECRSGIAMPAQYIGKLEEIVGRIKCEPLNHLTSRFMNHDDGSVLRDSSSLRVCRTMVEFVNAPDNQGYVC